MPVIGIMARLRQHPANHAGVYTRFLPFGGLFVVCLCHAFAFKLLFLLIFPSRTGADPAKSFMTSLL